VSDKARRKATRRELPALFLIYGAIFAAGALGLPFAASRDLAKKSDLHSISGSVQSAPRTTISGKAGTKLHIFIRGNDGLHHLTQDDLSRDVPQIMDLRAGDNVIARVKHDSLGRDLDWLWELQRDGITILSYEDTNRHLQRRNAGIRELAHWARPFSRTACCGHCLEEALRRLARQPEPISSGRRCWGLTGGQ
jgi:hypothetical protein